VAPPKYSTNHEMAYTIMDFLFASQVRHPGDTCSWCCSPPGVAGAFGLGRVQSASLEPNRCY
jgi:hypothetical protein